MRRLLIFWLLILAPMAAAQDVPRLMQQTPPGETNPLCCAVAVTGMGGSGESVPVAPGAFNYIGVMASHVPENETVRVILEKPGEFREVYGIAYPFPGWPGLVKVLFFAPDDVAGEYEIRIRYAGRNSAPLLIRFIQPAPASIERGDLERPRTGRPL